MTFWTLIRRGLFHYRRTHAGVVVGVAAAVAVLAGAMFVGDSVSYTLRRTARMRLGKVELAIDAPRRFFRAALAGELQRSLHASAAPVLALKGFVVRRDGKARADNVNILGVDERFWRLGGAKTLLPASARPGCVLNAQLAKKLSITSGRDVLLRIEKPSLLPRAAPLAMDSDAVVRAPLVVASVASDRDFGRFSLRADQLAPLNVFVPLDWLCKKVGLAGRANMLLIGRGDGGVVSLDSATDALRKDWTLDDAGLELRELPVAGVVELRSRRVFLGKPVSRAAMKLSPDAHGVFTYFVNELRLGDRSTPYSMVSTIGGLLRARKKPRPLRDDEILLGRWIADDLKARDGDTVTLRYYVIGPDRNLVERGRSFRAVTESPPADDPTLMPDFPGLSDVKNCRDWKPGIEIDRSKIRPKDERYWRVHRGTPKAFVTLAAARSMWSNAFGDLTAVRYPLVAGAKEKLAKSLRRRLDPASAGLFFRPVRKLASAAVKQATDFRTLFLGFSFFLIVSALILVGLLLALGMQQRSAEVGLLLALGLGAGRVRRLLLGEGLILAAVGTVVGLPVAVIYTAGMLRGLRELWPAAVANSAVTFHASAGTLAIAASAGVAVAAAVIWIISLRQARQPARRLLAGAGDDLRFTGGRGRLAILVAIVCGAAAGVIVALGGAGRDTHSAGAFFSAGALLLTAFVALVGGFLARLGSRAEGRGLSLAGLSVRNLARRRARSVSVIALLACGVFLVISVGANRRDPFADAQKVTSGTGGYALWARSSLGVFRDPNSPQGRRQLGLGDVNANAKKLRGATVLPMLVRQGDDASCLNLNRAQRPTLLGVNPASLATRGAFTFTAARDSGGKNPWTLLETSLPEGEVAAIGDEDTIVYGLGKKLGDTLDYVDERGRGFRVRIVGQLAGSIFQGKLLISEANFRRRFPSLGGYRLFLVDASPRTAAGLERLLSRDPAKIGLSVETTAQKLATFAAVVNTYLSIFQVLGGLGVLLGSIGLGMIVMRNVLARRGELALMRAVGFTGGRLFRLVAGEHLQLVLLGTLGGALAGVVAVLPALRSPGARVPYGSLAATLAVIVLGCVAWTLLATYLALRGRLIDALRDE